MEPGDAQRSREAAARPDVASAGRNPTIGWFLAVGVAWLHRYDETDAVTPPSTIAVAGMYSENDSSAGFLIYRGDQTGRWRDRHMYALQAELRGRVWRRFGAAAWAGVGGAGSDLSDLFHNPLPNAGVGIRYQLPESERLNFPIDFAWGKEEFTIYFAVGEAF